MSQLLTARDLWPLVLKLPHDEQVRLARLALRAAADPDPSTHLYSTSPPDPDEFSSDDDPLAWEGEGWEEFRAPR